MADPVAADASRPPAVNPQRPQVNEPRTQTYGDAPIFKLLDELEQACVRFGYARRDAPEAAPRYAQQSANLRVQVVALIREIEAEAAKRGTPRSLSDSEPPPGDDNGVPVTYPDLDEAAADEAERLEQYHFLRGRGLSDAEARGTVWPEPQPALSPEAVPEVPSEPPLDVGLPPLTPEQAAEGERRLHEAGPFAALGTEPSEPPDLLRSALIRVYQTAADVRATVEHVHQGEDCPVIALDLALAGVLRLDPDDRLRNGASLIESGAEPEATPPPDGEASQWDALVRRAVYSGNHDDLTVRELRIRLANDER